jgi:hypothetical protein
MSTKQFLAVAGLACDLSGAFLLAIPTLVGVENAVGSILRARERLLRLQQYLSLKRGIIVGFPDSRDLRKEDEGQAIIFHPARPQYLIAALVIFAMLAWYFMERNFGYIVQESAIVHGNLEYFGIWRYLFYSVAGLILVVVLLYAFALGLMLFLTFFWPFLMGAVVGAALIIVRLVTFIFFTIPAKFLSWFANKNQERKLGWIGFFLLILGFIFQGCINFMD